MKRTILVLAVLAGGFSSIMAQTSYSLKEAQDYAVQHSFNAQQAQLDVDAAKSKIKEVTAIGLPQINAEAGYQNFLNIPTTLIPARFSDPNAPLDQYFPVKFGQPHNLSASVTATQLLFNGSYIVGLQASRAYSDLIENQRAKTSIQVRQDVANAYFLVIAANENVKTLGKGTATLEQVFKETRALYENGLAEEQDSDQLKINLNNLQNSLENAKQQAVQVLNLLKFQMGLPQTTDLILTDSMESLTDISAGELMDPGMDVAANIDYKLALNNLTLQQLNVKNKRSAYLPTLAAFATQQATGFGQKFDFFDSKKQFYPTSIVGLSLTVPIFSSGQKHQQVVQARLELDKAKIIETQAKEGIQLEQQNARDNFKFQLKNLDNQKENLALSEKVKSKTLIKFKEGVASSFQLAQSESQFLLAQAGYIQAVINTLNAQIQFQKAFNKLN